MTAKLTQAAAVLTAVAITIMAADASAVTPPYAEDFESEPTCSSSCTAACNLSTTGWMNDPANGQDWQVDIGGTTSSPTGPPFDHTLMNATGKYLYMETSSPCSNQTNTASLISPPLELAGTTLPAARFWYHLFGADIGTLHVDVLDSSMAVLALDVIPSVTDNIDLWQQSAVIDLTPFIANGNVHVRLRGIHSGAGFWGDMALDDFSFSDLAAPDVGVTAITSPSSGCGLGMMETVTVTLMNFGGTAQSNFDVSYTLNGGAAVTETFTGPLAAMATASFSFATPADLSVAQVHTVQVQTNLAGDVGAGNDSSTAMVTNLALLAAAFPYVEDFEMGAGDWASGGVNSSWALGTPANTQILGAASGVNAWVTGLMSPHNVSEDSAVTMTSCLDFSGLTNPAISLNIWWEADTSNDGAVLQSSIDGGATWQNVGAFGDPFFWFNDNTIGGNPGGQQEGWTGDDGNGSAGYVNARHNLDGLAGVSGVLLRVAFGSNTFTQEDGVAFDDVSVFDNNTQTLEVLNIVGAGSVGASNAGDNNVLIHTFDLAAFGPAVDVDSIAINNPGTSVDADFAAVALWLDDGDLVFDSALDTLLDLQTFNMGTATFNTMGMLTVASGTADRMYVTVDIDPMATPGGTFNSEIVDVTMDIVAMNTMISAINPPIIGSGGAIGGLEMNLPFVDDFSSPVVNRFTSLASGLMFPEATSVGPMVTIGGPSTKDARIQLLPNAGSLTPVFGNSLVLIDFPGSTSLDGTGSLDYRFDLSAFAVANDILWFQFYYTDSGEENDNADYIFVSVDGGATWAASLFDWDWTNSATVWDRDLVDVTAALVGAGVDYTNDVLIRLQASDDFPFTSDGLIIDQVELGSAPETEIERPLGTLIPDNGSDAMGSIAAVSQSNAYAINNVGDFDLVIDTVTGITTANPMNVMNVVVTQPMNGVVASGGSEMFQVDFDPGIGMFSFDIVVPVADPYLGDDTYTITVTGDGNEAIPEIDIQDSMMMSIASGMNVPQGMIEINMSQMLTFEVLNLGWADLNITSTTAENAVNCTPMIDQAPMTPLTMMTQSTMDVSYTVTADGPFSFDIVVVSDDTDEAMYSITIDGDGDDPTNMGGGGMGGMGTGGMATGGMASGGMGTGAMGTGGDGGDGTGTGGGGGSDSSSSGGATGDDSSCGCFVVKSSDNDENWMWLLSAAGFVALSRRRRRAA